MNADNAKEFLKREKIPPYSYSFGPDNRSSECYIIEHRHDGWVVYYWERGEEIAPKSYPNEEIAVEVFVDKVIRSTK